MRTFIIRARKGTTQWGQLRSKVGRKEHLEILAHSVLNAFFVSKGFREAVEVYLILDSAEDFPRTILLSGQQGLSIDGFHEEAILLLVEKALKESHGLKKDETKSIAPGLSISGFGFERLIASLIEDKTLYILDPKGENIQTIELSQNPVFILSDHLCLPKKNVKSLKRQGIKPLSLGKKMLFASQCITIIHYEMDRLT